MSERTPELADIIRQAIEDRLAEVHVMLPGRIDAYDATLQKADVEPLIRRLQKTVDGEIKEDLPVIPGVPVVFPRAGGFKITMPVQAGDRCMLVFCERSIETYQTGTGRRGDNTALIRQSDPDTFEMHNLSDPVAIMGWYNDAEALGTPDATDMVIGEDNGPVIHIGGDQVNLYQKSGSGHDFVALAQKTNQRISDLEQAMIAFVGTDHASHTHLVPTPASPVGTQPSGPPVPAGTAPTAGSSVAAQKVKAT